MLLEQLEQRGHLMLTAMWPETRDCSSSFILTTEWNMEFSMAMDMGSVVLSGGVLTDPKF
jgi:hypothetical protein